MLNALLTARGKLRIPMSCSLLNSRLIHAATHDTMSPTLREYQKTCIDKCLNELALGTRRQIVSLPVGSGKTVVMANLLKKIPDPTPLATKTLILAHRTELLEQACNQIKRFHPDWNVVIDQGRRKPDIDEANVVIASVQTLARMGSERLARYDPNLFKAIMIDEVHHAAAKTYVRVLEHFQSLSKDSHVFVWGCSATVRRHDGIGLQGIFDEVVYHKDLLQMIEEKWLCPVKVTTIETSVDLSKVSIRNDDFSTSQLAAAVNTTSRNDVIFHSWQKYAAGERKSTLVFAVDMAHTLSLCNHFRANGVEADFITSKTPTATRQQALERFKRGEIPVMVNCGILTEGTDIPRVDCILMARPTRSSVLFQQMFGRGMRLHPDKQDCLVIDFVDNFNRTGKDGLVTFPTLMGLDYRYAVTDTSLLELEKIAEEHEEKKRQSRELVNNENDELISPSLNIAKLEKDSIIVTITEYDDLGQVAIKTSGSSELCVISKNCWVSVGDNLCVLQVLRTGTLLVKRADDGYWTGTFQPVVFDGKQRHYLRPHALPMVADTRSQAVRAADTWIQQYLISRGQGSLLSLLSRNAKFRQHPASESQMQVLEKKYKIKTDRELTKGQAMDLLVRLQHGQSKVWRQRIKEQLEKQSKAHAKRERAILLRTR